MQLSIMKGRIRTFLQLFLSCKIKAKHIMIIFTQNKTLSVLFIVFRTKYDK